MYVKIFFVVLFVVLIVFVVVVGVCQNQNGNNGVNVGFDFGFCNFSIDFVFGCFGCQVDEGIFLFVDFFVVEGQQEVLNLNIIINRVCDQFINVCEVNDVVKVLCEQVKV